MLTYIMKDEKTNCLKVIRENINPAITPKSCELYLLSHYPAKQFNNEDINKCYRIFDLLLRKCNFREYQDRETHIGFEAYKVHHGLLYIEDKCKSHYAEDILFNKILKIICFDLKYDNKFNNDNLVWTIDQILADNTKYDTCIKFWTSITDHEDIRNVLLQIFLDDIIDHIFSVMKY